MTLIIECIGMIFMRREVLDFVRTEIKAFGFGWVAVYFMGYVIWPVKIVHLGFVILRAR